MNTFSFTLLDWLALSPGLTDTRQWQEWAQQDMRWPEDPAPVPANLIPPMMRRRTSQLSKLALQAALTLTQDQPVDYIVFASRHGELARTIALIESIQQGEEASPTNFAQTVHNTAAGLFTIAANRPVPVTAIAAGQDTLHNAFVDAAAYLAEHPDHRVLLVDYDAPLPSQFQSFDAGNYQSYALAMLLTGGEHYRVHWDTPTAPEPEEGPITLKFIKHLLSNQHQWQLTTDRHCWSWQRHHEL
ncbi:beta-ketoacyl synthase chain length factor [Photobacterium sp. TY1-4]|uniref:beta-ketoacyl synthase chain length factor n=1 Tax=Photobacterium sp. TY1-4 TaxID=2899122 RepID=UPI0021C02738|nr:beta-ketoacyl synthase chain length factor [Photobacterium sp. TY1-4]UXI03417.1 beta-ketoacyl synthase chain length factor [Photobacterium sp. TY1-4]